MLGIIITLPPILERVLFGMPPDVLAAYILLFIAPIPILCVITWGFSHLWLDYKQEQFEHHLSWINLEVRVPQSTIQTPKGMENFFANLAGTKGGVTWREEWLLGKDQPRFSFEIISNGGRVSFVIRTQEKFRDIIEADLYAQYPDAQITEVPDYTSLVAKTFPSDDQDVFGSEIVLGKPNYFPLRTYEDFEHAGEKENRFKDPLFPLLELMTKIQPGEFLWVQLIIKPPSDDGWVKEGLAYLAKVMGKEDKSPKKGGILKQIDGLFWFPFGVLEQLFGLKFGGGGAEKAPAKDDFRMFRLTTAEKMQIDAVAEKVSKVGWRAKIRWLGIGPKAKYRKGLFASGIKGAIQPFGSPILNQLAAHGPSIPKDDYFWQALSYHKKQTTLVRRYASRSFGAGATPCILNAEELATLFHFPGPDARVPAIPSFGARRSDAPTTLPVAPVGKIGGPLPKEPSHDDWRRVYLERRVIQGTSTAVAQGIPERPHAHDEHTLHQEQSTHEALEAHLGMSLPTPHAEQSTPHHATHDTPPDNLPV